MDSIQSHIFRAGLRLQRRFIVNVETSAEQRRARFEHVTRLLRRMPTGVQVAPVAIGDVPGEWLIPNNADPNRLMLYLHGGGFMMGSPATHRAMVARIALACRARILLPDYRLAPECPYPAALDDSVAAYHWLRSNHGGDPAIVLAGDSAGGGLVISTLLRLREADQPLPAAGVCLSPFIDFTLSGDSIVTRAEADPYLAPNDHVVLKYYLGQHDPRDPLLSPVFADMGGLPPLFIQVGHDEVLLSDAERLAQRAEAGGVPVTLEIWSSMWHVWQFFAPYMPESQRAIDRIGEWVLEKTG
ncbi:MAG: alpha/beta hydrolase [Anaerolineaceae bacterium]|nr:alpha/beta hydrolase [Anaerolineaceae bacterium]